MGWSGAGKATTPEKGVGPGKRVNELTLGGKEERIACRRLSARYVNTRSPGPTPSRNLLRCQANYYRRLDDDDTGTPAIPDLSWTSPQESISHKSRPPVRRYGAAD
jgi:hypothetical protein